MNAYEIAVIVAVACLGFAVLMVWWSSDRVAKATEETEKAWGVADERGDAITELEAMVINLTDRNERLHEDQRRMRERLPALFWEMPSYHKTLYPPADDGPVGKSAVHQFWSCGTEGHTKVEWRGNVAHCTDCGRSSADVVEDHGTGGRGPVPEFGWGTDYLDYLSVDGDVTRPYLAKPDGAGDGR